MASDISPALRLQVAERANFRCEYCLIHEDDSGYPHQIDHIISRKHGGDSSFANLAYACVLCNRHKGSDVATLDPVTGAAVRLFDPRRDCWTDHFQLRNNLIESETEIGMATLRILRLNAYERIAERAMLQGLEHEHSIQPAKSE